jgi:hypothetical protein
MKKLRATVLFALLMAIRAQGNSEVPLVAGPPDLSRDAGIAVTHDPLPGQFQGKIISSTDGHRCGFIDHFGGAGHTNEPVLFLHAPSGQDIKIDFKYVYWETGAPMWINENLLFARIWWGRHWGTDYIFNADTGRIAYHEGFEEPHVPPN